MFSASDRRLSFSDDPAPIICQATFSDSSYYFKLDLITVLDFEIILRQLRHQLKLFCQLSVTATLFVIFRLLYGFIYYSS